jgi:parvulin-like peptidyl-prolyl isomerase
MKRLSRPVLLGIALGLLVILLLESFGLAQVKDAPATRAALVNGEAITLGEVDAVIRQRPAPLTPPTIAQVRQLRFEILAGLIDDLLVRQFLRENGPKVDASEIDKQVAALEKALAAQKRTLADYLKEHGQTEAQVRAGMAVLLQLDHYVKQHSTEADLRKYYEANRDYFDRVTVRTSHIVIRLPADAPPTEREKARQKLAALRAELSAGKIDFAAAAKAHSHCPSAGKGGDIGFIHRKFQNVDEAFAKAAFALKVGELSDVVETEYGLHLIKVTDRTQGKPTKFEQVLEDVRDGYAEELRVGLLDRLRKQAKIEVALP